MKVLITTSGIGSRLGNLTKYTNKALIRINEKPVISYIIEAYPESTEFVITLGYYGELVKEFLSLAYPEKKFEFVQIDKYQGPGSSLGYSMLQAKNSLQCPFIFNACDTIVESGSIPEPSYDWLGGHQRKGGSDSEYRTLMVKGNFVLKINEKGELNYDYDYIGLAGIHDYKKFWNALEKIYLIDPNNDQLSDCHAINASKFTCVEFPMWFDIGNASSLRETRDFLKKDSLNVLDKPDESIFKIGNSIIKFFSDENIVRNRFSRANLLKDCVPKITGCTKHFYKYDYVQGNLFSEVATPGSFKELLKWAKENLWIPNSSIKKEDFKKNCLRFYREKTLLRLKRFCEEQNVADKMDSINETDVPRAESLIKSLDWDWVCDSQPYGFHGDFILDNIVKTENSFKLLDWRQDFDGLIECGDIYYDIGKLYHNLTVNHEIINKKLFKIEVDDKNGLILCDILTHFRLQECKNVLENFIKENKFNLKKIKIITSLIWLNMAPLHHYPFNIFLYYFGRYNLFKGMV